MRRFLSPLLQFTPRDRLSSLFAIGMLTGAIWYFSVPFEPGVIPIAVSALAAATACVVVRGGAMPPVVFAGSVLMFGVCLGAASGKGATLRLNHVQIERPMGPISLEGWIERVEPGRNGNRLVIRVHAIDGLADAATPHTVRLTHRLSLATQPGRFVQCWAVLRPPPAPIVEGDYVFDRQAWYSGLGAVGYVQGRCRGGALGPPTHSIDQVALKIGQARRQLAQHVRTEAGLRAGGLAAALASGDRSFLDAADQEALRRAGLAHLLAISGLHIGIVGGLVFLIVWRGLAFIEPLALRWSVKKPAALAAILACAAYLVISGASVSTQRAFVMAFVFFGAVLIDRVALTQRSVEIAMVLIILLAPWSVLTPGFQMSFAATLVLITTYEVWQRRRRNQVAPGRTGAVFWLKSLVVTSAVTSLATAPYALYHFERVASLSVLANIAAMPIISLISAPCAAAALMPAPVGLDAWPLRGFGLSLEWVLAIAHGVGDASGGDQMRIPAMPVASLALFSAALVSACVTSGRTWRLGPAGILILAASLMWMAAARDRVHWAPSGDIFLEHASGRVERVAVKPGDGLSPLRFADIPTDLRCETGTRCIIAFGTRTLSYDATFDSEACPNTKPGDVILTPHRALPCMQRSDIATIAWADVIREQGVTLEWRRGAFRKRWKLRCGRRPWRPCQEF